MRKNLTSLQGCTWIIAIFSSLDLRLAKSDSQKLEATLVNDLPLYHSPDDCKDSWVVDSKSNYCFSSAVEKCHQFGHNILNQTRSYFLVLSSTISGLFQCLIIVRITNIFLLTNLNISYWKLSPFTLTVSHSLLSLFWDALLHWRCLKILPFKFK